MGSVEALFSVVDVESGAVSVGEETLELGALEVLWSIVGPVLLLTMAAEVIDLVSLAVETLGGGVVPSNLLMKSPKTPGPRASDVSDCIEAAREASPSFSVVFLRVIPLWDL